MRAHHLGTRHLLGGTVGDGLTVSRTCLDYVLESQAANNARQAPVTVIAPPELP